MRQFLASISHIVVVANLFLVAIAVVELALALWLGDRTAAGHVLDNGRRATVIAGVWAVVYLLAIGGRASW